MPVYAGVIVEVNVLGHRGLEFVQDGDESQSDSHSGLSFVDILGSKKRFLARSISPFRVNLTTWPQGVGKKDNYCILCCTGTRVEREIQCTVEPARCTPTHMIHM